MYRTLLWVLTFYEKESRGTNPEWNISKEEIALLCSNDETKRVVGSPIQPIQGMTHLFYDRGAFLKEKDPALEKLW